MGRIVKIKYLVKGLQYKIVNLLPYKYRKPFILYFSMLGMIAYYNLSIYFSYLITGQENTLLATIGAIATSFITTLKTFENKEIIILLLIGVVIYATYKYCVVEEKEEQDSKNKKEKENYNRSWYSLINSYISLGYALITILTFLHLFWRY